MNPFTSSSSLVDVRKLEKGKGLSSLQINKRSRGGKKDDGSDESSFNSCRPYSRCVECSESSMFFVYSFLLISFEWWNRKRDEDVKKLHPGSAWIGGEKMMTMASFVVSPANGVSDNALQMAPNPDWKLRKVGNLLRFSALKGKHFTNYVFYRVNV